MDQPEAADAVLAEADADAHATALARALSSPLRMRVLRLCRFDARTNAELADLLEVNPATMLHHVRTLVRTGLLAADPERIGTRGAREVPYRATGLSWNTPVPGMSVVLLETMRQQLQGVDPEQVDVVWLGLRLNPDHRAELRERINRLATEFKNRGPDPDGEAYSLVMVTHPELNPHQPEPSARTVLGRSNS